MIDRDQGAVYRVRLEAPVSEPPRRVVSAVPSVTESLFELQLGDRVIAITEDCRYPENALASAERIGPVTALQVDRIVALHPDLVIVNRDENRPEDLAALSAHQVPIWVTGPRTVRDAFNLLWAMMDVFETPTMVEAIRALEWQCDWLERLDESRSQVCKVFVLTGLNPLTSIGGDGFASDLLRVCGGSNVFAARTQHDVPGPAQFPVVTQEAIAAARPNVVLVPMRAQQSIATLDVIDDLVRDFGMETHIRFIDESLLFWHGTRIARAFKALPHALCALDSMYDVNG